MLLQLRLAHYTQVNVALKFQDTPENYFLMTREWQPLEVWHRLHLLLLLSEQNTELPFHIPPNASIIYNASATSQADGGN